MGFGFGGTRGGDTTLLFFFLLLVIFYSYGGWGRPC